MSDMRASFESWAKSFNYNCDSWDMLMYDSRDTELAWEGFQAAYNMQQAVIDRLMLEHCPDEMTEDQMEAWAKGQRKVEE